MADVLAEICARKRDDVARRRAERPLASLEAELPAEPPRRFADKLGREVAATGFGLIAELKKASPSKGLIRAEFDPAALARAYAEGGAACLSVLTDAPYFQGDDAYLRAARAAVELPVLRKDFMLEPWQIVESRALGADAVLLIMAALDDALAGELEAAAHGLGMDVLVEVHDDAELERALRLRSTLIGINNRDLKTLNVDLATTERLAPRVPHGKDVVCESGLHGHADLVRMANQGVRRFLVGESLMRQADVAAATKALLGHGPAPAEKAHAPGPAVPAADLTHFDDAGNAVMVDVGAKAATERSATARGRIVMAGETLTRIRERGVVKGDVLGVAQLAGIMGAKRTPDLIPLCHPLGLSAVEVTLTLDPEANAIEIEATCRVTGQTGVEMEALTAVAVAALTVYDMCKAVDRAMRIEAIRLVEKSGGRSGTYKAG